MKRKILFFILLPLVLSLSGCSMSFTYVLVNETDQPIEVIYKLKRTSPDAPAQYVSNEKPAVLTVKELEKSRHEWRDLTSNQYEFDGATGTYKVSLGPDEVLRITSNRGGDDDFDIASISIRGAKGSVDLKGDQTRAQFKGESDTRYVLRYR